MGFLLPSHVLDAQHPRVVDLLLALEAPSLVARKRGPVQRILHLFNGMVPGLSVVKLFPVNQRIQPLRDEQPVRVGLDVLIRTPGLGDWFHVPD
ncbi:hypothetical protein AM228_21315 [Planktothricoides sp. SR001]|nr:hypothetical protein AM228_21315 [Planktothricoides sp. SR001]